MKTFSEQLRYEYPELTKDSIIIDAGGYEGNWFKPMFERYGCRCEVYEPASLFYHKCCIVSGQICESFGPIVVHNSALSNRDGVIEIGINGDSTGRFNVDNRKSVKCVNVSNEVERLGNIAVLKLNIEGMEYDVLMELIETGLVSQVENIQVQFHYNFPGAREEHSLIREALLATHEPEWDSEPTWQNFRKR